MKKTLNIINVTSLEDFMKKYKENVEQSDYKFILLADLHLKHHAKVMYHGKTERLRNGQPHYFTQFDDLVENLTHVLFEELKADDVNVMLLGDTFDEYRPLPSEFYSASNAFRSLFGCCANSFNNSSKFYVSEISGNHTKGDMYGEDYSFFALDYALMKNSEKNSMLRFKTRPTIDRPNSIGVDMLYLPYDPELKVLTKFYVKRIVELSPYDSDRDFFERDTFKIVNFHFGIANAMYDNGITSSSGVILEPDCFDGFDLAIGGDYHTHQKIDINCPTYYVGAPFQFHFGHSFEPMMGMLTLNKKNGVLNYFVIPTKIFCKTMVRFEKADINDFDSCERIVEMCEKKGHFFMNVSLRGNIVDDDSANANQLLLNYEKNNPDKLRVFSSVRTPRLASSPDRPTQPTSGKQEHVTDVIQRLRNVSGERMVDSFSQFAESKADSDSLRKNIRKALDKIKPEILEAARGGKS